MMSRIVALVDGACRSRSSGTRTTAVRSPVVGRVGVLAGVAWLLPTAPAGAGDCTGTRSPAGRVGSGLCDSGSDDPARGPWVSNDSARNGPAGGGVGLGAAEAVGSVGPRPATGPVLVGSCQSDVGVLAASSPRDGRLSAHWGAGSWS
jgi:hypothetical protein